uniref:Amino acid transporter transmembrane domain-containing protein n=1 Tax=Oryza punctata TaxID=4537 RepID=A0A0E0JRS0_ORYPU
MNKNAAPEDVESGEHERTGTVWTATAHIVTAVIGSGVLALAWSVAQLGWVAGPLALAGFACVTYYTSTLLANAYRAPHPVTGTRNRTYMDAVRSYLSPREVFMCGIAQYVNLWGTMVGYTITATISMVAIRRSDCIHRNGAGAGVRCDNTSATVLMLAFSIVQVVLSQFPGLEHITWLSVVAAVMSFAYSFIGLGLSVAEWVSHGGHLSGRIQGTTAASSSKKLWNVLLALGNIAFAYTFAEVLIEIQDTLKPSPPENKTMKKAAMYGIGATTIFYISVGCAGYAAFGSDAPGNILTASGLGPFWLVDIANMCLILHLIGAYQVYAQPIFATMERWISSRWPEAKFINSAYTVSVPLIQRGSVTVAPYKLVLRTVIVVATTVVAMMIPFFNAVLGLLGAFSFWPLTVYFPISMHIAQEKITKGGRWYLLQGLSMVCLMISVAVGIGSVTDIVDSLKVATPFKTVS